ncbi:hypothetical protein M422DRAFT_265522 [Sphaerobolus stellatus SS14]|uniref:Uncharacterized protein n=1 Tax=Sphaerobolus stellatus (strain SS14) TaxID=990650 RepID=A0A0C9V562_SPHS4|nr:hypothetical protein M422DRAFT_265522 [Sphaerobolus stellatus SS14]
MSALTNLSVLPNFKTALSKVKHIVTVTGAGLSAASGRAQPNTAHCAITLLSSSKDELDRIVSLSESISLITQNIDGLPIRALPPDSPKEA